MDADSRVAESAAGRARRHAEKAGDAVAEILLTGALPEEIAGFGEADQKAAAAFIAAAAAQRDPQRPVVRLESVGGEIGRRRMRLAVINDDMPFLVDSVAAALAARDLIIHRLLHPVVCVTRDDEGRLATVEPLCPDSERRESFLYMEIERAAASTRQQLLVDIDQVLSDVRTAVADWEQLQAKMHAAAEELADGEASALLHWFAEGAMTLLGYQIEHQDGRTEDSLGLLGSGHEPVWDPGSTAAAVAYFDAGGSVPLIAKADRLSTVHRRVPFDLVVLPVRDGGKVTGITVHAGLWTSQALRAPGDDVPVLRQRLAQFGQEFGFDPKGHAGKALRHSIASLPRDLLVALPTNSVKQIVATAMSLADRPRPALALARSILKGHLFAFVWLPREELSTSRRKAIAEMIATAAEGWVSNWSVELGDGDLALLRYTIDIDPAETSPDCAHLAQRLDEMVRGWEPSVEEVLATMVGATRASRLAMTLVRSFPEEYRARTVASEAALDVLRLSQLVRKGGRGARLFADPDLEKGQIRLKTYRRGAPIALSEAVPVLENFGFQVLEERPTALGGRASGFISDFLLETGAETASIFERSELIEGAIAQVLENRAENDPFNQLLIAAALDPSEVVLLRAWFRYLRQTGISYSMATVVEALRKAPDVAAALVASFKARHDPKLDDRRDGAIAAAEEAVRSGLTKVAAIDEDRILRLLHAVVLATLRTNAFTPAGEEALAFKLDSSLVPGLPAPVPWREIWVYSPRVEGIHLRGGPVARGGIRWSDRRDDFRTEILGLLKAQVVKNAVIVPTGAKGGFFPKQLPPPAQRDAWLAEGTEAYAVFIRALLSITDNIVGSKVVHPDGVVAPDGEDPYFVVAADKGTAKFSDLANSIALSRNFWLGDAFASGGSKGYDHKAMGITARGAWVCVQRHFREMGIDVQTDPVRVAGCGDMSGDVFGNGMLLSKSIKLVAAFDHRHIFVDPEPDPARSWDERKRLFELPRSSWDDYDRTLLSAGGGIFPRTQKAIPLTPEMKAALAVDLDEADPTTLINAILRAPVDLIWFGGIGTYIKGAGQAHADVGDPANDALRVNGSQVRAKVIGEGANLAVTQAGRIEFAEGGGRINTDFIDNSAGVDCSDNEVNIKIPLNREMAEGRITPDERDRLLADMTEQVAELVLEDNRLQSLALSIAEMGGAAALPSQVRAIEILEESGRLSREVEGLESNETLLRRATEDRGLTRPELAVLLSTTKMALQDATESSGLIADPTLEPDLLGDFPALMRERHAQAIREHRLRGEIIATVVANRFVNRLGILAPFALAEEEGCSWSQAASAFVAAEQLFDMASLWREIEELETGEDTRLRLFERAAAGLQLHIADIVRSTGVEMAPGEIVALLAPGLAKLDTAVETLLRAEARSQADTLAGDLADVGAPADVAARIVRLFKLNGGIGIAALGRRMGADEVALTRAYTRIGEALGLDWAHSTATRFTPKDYWERVLSASLARDFEQLRLDFLERNGDGDPEAAVEQWLEAQAARADQFRHLVTRARAASEPSIPMLAQIATQTRVLLGR